MFNFWYKSRLQLVGERIYLRPPRRRDRRAWLQLRRISEQHLKNWEPGAADNFLHSDNFRAYYQHIQLLQHSRRGEGWLIFAQQTDTVRSFGGSDDSTNSNDSEADRVKKSREGSREGEGLLGSITVSNMRFGSVQTASLGYWLGEPYLRQGIMREALALVLDRLFTHYRLNRIEAATLPENHASRALLDRLGFEYEGLCRQYFAINGRFQDHKLFSLLAEDYGKLNR